MRCGRCGAGFLGRVDARFCSTRCRVAWHRALPQLPKVMTSRQAWVRAAGKRPVMVDGAPASSTDPSTWASWVDVHRSSAGDGFGVMLGGGLACWDLDHCVDGEVVVPWAREQLEQVGKILWLERSVSGAGLHAFVAAAEGAGVRTPGVEFYSWGRFIRVTGDRFTIASRS